MSDAAIHDDIEAFLGDPHGSSRPRQKKVTAETKWGDAVSGGDNGYQLVPDVLLRRQRALNLDPTDIVVLLNICMHWWESEPQKMPHPRAITIAKRMGASTRTVERHIGRLSKLGYVKWLKPKARPQAPSIREFDLGGLVKALARLADESTETAAAEDSTQTSDA
jgi:Helix-turn-helix domain